MSNPSRRHPAPAARPRPGTRPRAAGRGIPEPPGRLLTPAETAAVLRIEGQALYRLARTGKITPVKTPGGSLRYPEAEVSRVLAEAQGPLMTSGEVAALFRVDPRTVGQWARDGKLHSLRPAEGPRRYLAAQVLAARDSADPPALRRGAASGIEEGPHE